MSMVISKNQGIFVLPILHAAWPPRLVLTTRLLSDFTAVANTVLKDLKKILK